MQLWCCPSGCDLPACAFASMTDVLKKPTLHIKKTSTIHGGLYEFSNGMDLH